MSNFQTNLDNQIISDAILTASGENKTNNKKSLFLQLLDNFTGRKWQVKL